MKKRPGPERRPSPPVGRSWAFAIARAAYRLPDTLFRAFSVILELDRPDKDRGRGVGGAFLGEVEFAHQCGRPLDSVLDARADLVRLGLVRKVQPAGSRQAWWFATLPDHIDRKPPSAIVTIGDSRKRHAAIRRWLREQADQLDRQILERQGDTNFGHARQRAKGGKSTPILGDRGETTPTDRGETTPPENRKGVKLHPHRAADSPPSEAELAGNSAASESLKTSLSSRVNYSPAETASPSPDCEPPVNGGIPSGDEQASVAEILQRLEAKVAMPNGESLDQRRERFRAMAGGAK